MRIADWRAQAVTQLKSHSHSPATDVDLILEFVTKKTKTEVYIKPDHWLSESIIQQLNSFIQRRVFGEPVAYLIHQQAFWTMELTVTPDTLIPRPETECLIEWVLNHFSNAGFTRKDEMQEIRNEADHFSYKSIADLGTGSGAISIALALERPRWKIHAIDQSQAALIVAKQNARKYQLTNIDFYQGDWCDALPDTQYDLIISNPPYLAENDPHLPSLKFEPSLALISGHDGLQAIRIIITQAKHYLKPNGLLILEHGFNQQSAVLDLLHSQGFSLCQVHQDLSGNPRFITASFRIGILLTNIGTPDAPDVKSVRRFLKAFLLDSHVIPLPAILRHLLVHCLILPARTKQSAKLYQQIWTDQGSPILTHSTEFQSILQKQLGESYCVTLGMRYGNPSIDHAVWLLKKQCCDFVIVLPLFPQKAYSTTQSAIDNILLHFKKHDYKPSLKMIEYFYDQSHFIDALTNKIQHACETKKPDFILFSYHGLPVQHKDSEYYRKQCVMTSKYLANHLKLPESEFDTSFQSRLGKIKWIEPYTDQLINALYKKGVRHLAVVCPSFVTDCLETLEEINVRLRYQWESLGNTIFQYIPCLNADIKWIEKVADSIAVSMMNC